MKRLTVLTALACLLALPATAQADPPAISETTFSAVSTTSATLEATINPGGKSTPYHFEYGTSDCATISCKAVPSPDAPAGNGIAPLKVTFPLTGLDPGTTYHFRLLAKNSESPLDPETNEREYIKGSEATFTTHALPPTFGPCPNEAFRTGLPSERLPNCRAYEQATPIAKNAGEATSVPWLQAAADDGNAVTFLSDAGFPNAEGAQDMPLYLATRNANGWSTQGVLPSGTLAPHDARILGWLPGLEEVFSQGRIFASQVSKSFLSRPGVGPGTRIIAPFTPNVSYAYADSSADGRLVLFEEVAQTAEGNGSSTLWLWDRETNAKAEVSVLNDEDGSLAPVSAFAGPYDWVYGTTPKSLSEGGSNRLYYTHDSNVLAGDGSALYFTAAETGQLYLRTNPTEDQSPLDSEGDCTDPALACTINISKSRKTNGGKPDGTDTAGTQPAVFHAASVDGSKVFFTSSEKLTNDANTGVEPEGSPAIAKADSDGSPPSIDLNFLPHRATALTLDDTHIYWVDPDKEAIGRAELGGDKVEDEFLTGVETKTIAVDDEYVYWTDAGDGENAHGQIGRAKLDLTEVKPDFITGANNPEGIAVNATHVYWGDHEKAPQGPELALMRANVTDGSGAEEFGESGEGKPSRWPAYNIALSDTRVYFTGDGAPQNGSDCLHFVALADPKEFKNFACNGFHQGFYKGIAVDDSYVYWASPKENTIGRVQLDGSTVEAEFIKAAGNPQGLAVDASHLYWSANQEVFANPGNDLYRYDSGTGQLTDLTVDPDSGNGAEVRGVLGVSADGSMAYFAANGVLTNESNYRGEVATPGNCKGTGIGESGSCNLYLAQSDEIRFISFVEVGEIGSDRKVANWAPTPGAAGVRSDATKNSRLTPDGRYLLFTSSRQLADYDNGGLAVLYRYDAADNSLLCVSCNPSGERPGRTPALTGGLIPSTETPGPSGSILSRAFSTDGSRVFFETIDSLVGADTDGLAGCPVVGSSKQEFSSCQDVYQWQAPNTASCTDPSGCLHLLSPGDDDSPSFFAGASATGDDAFIFTRAQLVGSDQDQLRDVYDLRVGGGLASQYPVPPDICDAAEACKLGPSVPPDTPSPGTAGFRGLGDPPVKRTKCPKGKVRKKGKCVKKKAKRKHKKATRR